MGLTFWTMSLGGKDNLGVHWETKKTNPFFLANCNRWALVNAQRVQRAIKRRPRGPIYHRSLTTEWNWPILNMRECFLLTREKGRSQGWKDKLQIITWDIQHAKSAQQAPQAEEPPCCHVSSKNGEEDLCVSTPQTVKDKRAVRFHAYTDIFMHFGANKVPHLDFSCKQNKDAV